MMRNSFIASLAVFIFCSSLNAEEQKRGILSHIPKDKPLVSKNSLSTISPAPQVPQKKLALSDDQKELVLPPPPSGITITPTKKSPGKEEKTPKEEITPEPAQEKSYQEKEQFEKAKNEVIENQKVNFYFEDATLQNIVKYIETLFNITFLPDDAVDPILSGNGTLKGHKVSFKTNKALSRQEAWDVFVRLLDIAGLTIVPGSTSSLYRITSVTAANKDALPLYIGIDRNKIPTNAEKIRYVYFVKNNSLATIQSIVSSLASTTAKVDSFPDLDALIICDKAINIRSLMEIVHEFDETLPEAMSIIKLNKTDATTIAKLYQSLTQTETVGANRYYAQKKQPQSLYFPSDARIIPDIRTNSLIVIGRKEAIKKIEDFITKHIDIELDLPYSPLHIYSVQHTTAEKIMTILNQVISFGQGTIAQQGGVLGGQKYFDRDIKITPEPAGNNLIIRANEDDYKKLKEIIKELDVLQPQIAIEILIVDVTATNKKEWETQIRNKSDGSLISNVNAQTSGIGSITAASGGGLLGDLVSLISGSQGSSMLSVGNATNGVWGLFKVLNEHSDVKVLSNPFLLSTNNYAASFTFGETRQIQTATINEAGSFTDANASLSINITPQINSNNEIAMDIDIDITEFSNAATTEAQGGNTSSKKIKTAANVNNQEVLALGGITRNKIDNVVLKTPLLGDIPLLGNLFRSKTKTYTRSNLLIFISPRIITSESQKSIDFYTQTKIALAQKATRTNNASIAKDPIDRAFFNTSQDNFSNTVDTFMNPRSYESGYKTNKKLLNTQRKKEKAAIQKTESTKRKRRIRSRRSKK